jgi:two-component system, LuxR family, response regulator FixJ
VPAKPRSSVAVNAVGHTHRIGIIDDDLAVRESLCLLLETFDFRVWEFSSAAAFLRSPLPFCCLLIDLHMTETDGLQLLELLRLGGIQTPAILMIDKDEPMLAPRIRTAQAHDKLVKPITEERLLQAINSACVASHRAN